MQPNNYQLRQRLIISAILVLLVLPICLAVYGHRSNAYRLAATSQTLVFTNPGVLQNWLPDSSFTYTVARLNDYVQANDPRAPISSMAITSKLSQAGGAYIFNVEFLPAAITHKVSVRVINYGGVISTAVYIDDILQNGSAPATTTGATIKNISNLIDQGLSSSQSQALASALAHFKPDATAISIDADSITSGLTTSSGSGAFSFTITIDNQSYAAKLDSVDLDSIQLHLTSLTTNKQVFDSGVVTNNT